MRIVFVANTSWYLCNFRMRLMKILVNEGHSVHAIAPHDSYSSQFTENGVTYNPLFISRSGTNPFNELRTVLGLKRILIEIAADIVFSYTPKGNIYSLLAAPLKITTIVPNISGLGSVFVRKGIVTTIQKYLYRISLGRAKYVFFQNNEDRNLFLKLKYVEAKYSKRLPGSGVDIERFQPSFLHEENVLADLTSQHTQPFRFILVGRLLWNKGIGEYVEAAKIIRERHPESEFTLLGFIDESNPDSVPRRQIIQWEKEGIIRYLGETVDVEPYLASADCSILPSYYMEGVPRSLLESAAMGLPVITTNSTGCRDVVEDSKTGFLVKPRSAEDLAAKMNIVLGMTASQRLAMGKAAREKMELEFNEKIVLDSYLDIVKKVREAMS